MTDNHPETTPYALVLWGPDGAMHNLIPTAKLQPNPDLWAMADEAMPNRLITERRDRGWMIDGVDQDAYRVLMSHPGFLSPGSRQAFLCERQAGEYRTAAGVPEPYGWAAWAGDGALISLGRHQAGLDGWHALGIGEPRDDELVLQEVDAEEFFYLDEFSRYRRPGGRGLFQTDMAGGAVLAEEVTGGGQ